MSYGEEDFPHLIQQSQSMEHALIAAGGNVDRIELKGCNHLSTSYAAGDPDQLWVPKAVNWMKLH
jgi:dipeptidyl aminopeptidase/acylaminoacyl peptidase